VTIGTRKMASKAFGSRALLCWAATGPLMVPHLVLVLPGYRTCLCLKSISRWWD